MTKEIAIHNLYALKLRSKLLSDRDALDIAIKALEQQPCEDCISREAVIEWIDKSVAQYGGTYTHDMLTMWGLFKDWISRMPSVTPERPKGK